MLLPEHVVKSAHSDNHNKKGKVMTKNKCIFPECNLDVENKTYIRLDGSSNVWCVQHWGLFPHKCEHDGCHAYPIYDDEPYCFTHSPDSGSSFKGYSAYKKHLEKVALKKEG
jgi:hypothetical protein